MAAGRVRAAAAAILAGALALAWARPPAAAAQENASATLARAWLAEARVLSERGDWTGAASLLAEARAQDAGDSDIRYLSALALSRTGSAAAAVLGELDAAIASSRFSSWSLRDAALLKGAVLTRSRRWREALSALSLVAAPADADIAFARARAIAGSGDGRAFSAAVTEGLRRWPEDSRFARLFLERAGPRPLFPADRAIGDIVLGRIRLYAARDLELPVLAAPLMPDPVDRVAAIRAYRAAGGAGAAATLRAQEYGLIDSGVAAAELLSGAFPLLIGDLARLASAARDDGERSALARRLQGWTGTILADRDGDGIAEERTIVASGLVAGWRLDPDQDGVDEIEVEFQDGLPARASAKAAGSGVDVAWTLWPRLSEIAFTGASGSPRYYLAPEALSWSPLSLRAFVGSGREQFLIPEPSGDPLPTELACAASALGVETRGPGGEASFTSLDGGLPQRGESWKEGRLLSVTEYTRGKPFLETLDLDGDGRFETRRAYPADGAGYRASVDSDGDGIFEYSEESNFPFRKEWDFDADGSTDAVQYALEDGSLVREFSSRLDGRFDEKLTFKSGKLVAFAKGGSPASLVPDSNTRLRWIGAKPFDLGGNLPAGEGIYTRMGKRYRIIWAFGEAFAELVP